MCRLRELKEGFTIQVDPMPTEYYIILKKVEKLNDIKLLFNPIFRDWKIKRKILSDW